MFFSNLSNIFLWIINNLFVTYGVFQKWFETGCFKIIRKRCLKIVAKSLQKQHGWLRQVDDWLGKGCFEVVLKVLENAA